MSIHRVPIYFTILGTLALGGCEQAKEAVGLNRNSPDEFTALERAPLTQPPKFHELPTPTPGVERAQEVSPRDKAKKAVTRQNPGAGVMNEKSAGELALLKHAGVTEAEPDIRTQVNQEARIDNGTSESFIRDLVGYKEGKANDVIDPVKENERLTGKELPGDK